MALGTILGPLMGAAFTEYLNWRWIGWVNLPLLAIDVLLAALFLRLRSIDEPFLARLARVDWIGSLLFTVGTTASVLPLSWADNLYPWSSWKTLVPLIIGIFTLAVFGFYENRPERPMFPHRIFKSRTSLMTLTTGTLHGLIIYPATTYLPLFFQSVKLQSPLESAISMLPSCCGVVGFSLLSGVAVEINRRYLWQFWISWAIIAVGMGLFSMMNGQSSVAETAEFQLLASVGLGALFVAPNLSVQADALVQDQGIAAGLLIGFRLFGALIGLAIGSTVFASTYSESLSHLATLPDTVAALRDPSSALGFIPRLRTLSVSSEVLENILMAYEKTFQAIWYVMVGFACVGFVTSLFIREKSLEIEAFGRQHIQER